MVRLLAFSASLLCILLGSGCSHSFYYRVLQPVTQRDHPESEFGSKALREADLSLQGPVPGAAGSIPLVKPLARGKRTYLIIQVDGGGIMGITPARLLCELETAILSRDSFGQRRLRDAVSICSGTSTGAIIAGAIAAGVPASELSRFYEEDGYALFRGEGRLPLHPVVQYKFDRSAFQQEMIDVLRNHSPERPDVRLRELEDGPLLMIAAYDLVGRRTLFLRSRTDRGGQISDGVNIQLIDAISASAFSAAFMFGKLVAPDYEWHRMDAEGQVQLMRGAVFADGGQGTQNTTFAVAALEGIRLLQRDPGSQVVLISLGSGNDLGDRGFENVIGYWGYEQLADFLLNNQARSEAVILQWNAVRKMEEAVGENFKAFRFDWNHTSSKDASSFSINPRQRDWL
ncbi:MAG: patatin-like phospholipase family protein, partial [Verrucomicrobiota bacterium]